VDGGGPQPDAPPGLLRLSVTSDGGLDDQSLTERMRALFPGGIEETRDARGRLEVAAYAAPPLSLPADLGPWRIEPVEDMRARVWREDHHGVLIGGRLWVGPPSEQPRDDHLAVVIEQGHAFGSGAHATTTGCLELLCDLPETGSVLDLGCGSGVLSIAAVRLGHAPVYACDVDPLAVSAARENVRANGVDVEVFEADAASDELPAAELWLANLAKGPLSDVLARPDAPGRAILSGLFADDLPRMPGWRVEREVERAGWRALLVARVS
jgi:ribosomal protein L11 methyltransferase